MVAVRSIPSEEAIIQILTSPLQACETKGSKILLSWIKKWICNQKESVNITLVNLNGPPLIDAFFHDSGIFGSPTNFPSNSKYLWCECLLLD